MPSPSPSGIRAPPGTPGLGWGWSWPTHSARSDLIPDFIPVIGTLDDLLLVPLGFVVALKLVPPEVIASVREQAPPIADGGRLVTRLGAVLVLLIWLGELILVAILTLGWATRRRA